MAERLLRHIASAPAGRILLRQADLGLDAAEVRGAIAELREYPGFGDQQVVAVLADNGPDAALVDLAALHAGIAHLPLPGFFTPAQWRHSLDASGCGLALADRPEVLASIGAGFRVAGRWRTLSVLRREVPGVDLPPATAKISFTSGSTGTPRGACLAAAGLIDTAEALGRALANVPIARHFAALPLALLLENVAGLYGALLRGAEVCLPSLAHIGWRGMHGFDARALDRETRSSSASSAILVPELLKQWTLWLEARGQRAPGSLRLVAVGGARVDPTLLDRARAVAIPAYEGYGLTECGSVVTLNLPGDEKRSSVGKPLGHVRVRLSPAGEVLAEQRVFLGYLGEARPAGPVWPTGDLGHRDAEGYIHLSGRASNVLITAYGRNVSPEWVEAALTAQPEIAQCIVAGEARPSLGALVVPSATANHDSVAAAVARANALLPDYARVGAWTLVDPFDAPSGLATGNGRPVRAAVLSRHAGTLSSLFESMETCHELP